MAEDSFLGRGWAFPPSFTKKGEVDMVEARKDIEQSLEILLSTSLGERVLQPEYGCNLKDYQFEPMNASRIGFLRDMIENALLYHEPRIKVREVDITEADSLDAINGKLIITIDYVVRSTNSRFNFVYNFYQKEGVI